MPFCGNTVERNARIPISGNRAILFKLEGRQLARNPNVVRKFLSNDVPLGGYLTGGLPRQLPGAAHPWFGVDYHGKFVRFMKVETK